MNKSSLGIILNGDMRYKQEKSVQTKFNDFVFLVLPVCLIIISVILVFVGKGDIFKAIGDFFTTGPHWFIHDKQEYSKFLGSYPGEYALRLTLVAFFWLCLGTFIREASCPFCKHFFVTRRISGDKYSGSSSRNVSKTSTRSDPIAVYSNSGISYYNVSTSETKHGIETTNKFTYNTKCMCCGCVIKKEKEKTSTEWNN